MAEMIPDDQGRICVIKVVDPAGGGEFIHVQPARLRWRVISLKALFTADANAANRFFNLDLMVGGAVVLRMPVREEATAGQVWTINWFTGAFYTPDTLSLNEAGLMPEKLLVNNEMMITSFTDGIQVGDQWSQIYLMVEEWMEPLA